jgi:hypothetical protein
LTAMDRQQGSGPLFGSFVLRALEADGGERHLGGTANVEGLTP